MPGVVETKFTRSGDVDIAYQVVGEPGGLDIVFVAGWVSHLDVMWELAEYAEFLDGIAAMGRLIVFDKRGCGLSDRVAGMVSLEERATDVGAVLDAVGSEHAAIAAWGDGAAIAAMCAATHPERVDALVLGSLFLKPATGDDPSLLPDPAMMEMLLAEVERGWGEGGLAPVLAPSLAGDERFLAWFRKWQRMSATPNAAANTLRWATELDLGPVLPAVQAPTLILHRKGGAFVTLDAVHQAAAQMPHATCLELDGTDDLPFLGDADALLDEIQAFLTGAHADVDADRVLTTVMFTDIVGSTEKAESLGDRRWRYLLDDHHTRVRRLLDRFRGTEVDTAGDGFLATFDGPARGVRCACAIRDAVREIGIEIRAGLHTGEVQRRGVDVAGLAVHVGARVSALAQASEVLVTDTVQMLVVGSGITFVDRGLHTLKGVADQWHVFAVSGI
jgi:class 3 adenylate cyclase